MSEKEHIKPVESADDRRTEKPAGIDLRKAPALHPVSDAIKGAADKLTADKSAEKEQLKLSKEAARPRMRIQTFERIRLTGYMSISKHMPVRTIRLLAAATSIHRPPHRLSRS